MIAGLILSAGRSERMGQPKALLPLAGTTFLGHILQTANNSRLDQVRVVLGHEPGPIIDALELGPETVVINEEYDLGMLSSLHAGLRALAPLEPEAVVMFLVDHPRITAATVDSLIDAFRAGRGEIVIPTHGGRRGHPVLFGSSVFGELLAAPLDQGARAVVRAHPERVAEIPQEGPGILADIDTPEDYRRMDKSE